MIGDLGHLPGIQRIDLVEILLRRPALGHDQLQIVIGRQRDEIALGQIHRSLGLSLIGFRDLLPADALGLLPALPSLLVIDVLGQAQSIIVVVIDFPRSVVLAQDPVITAVGRDLREQTTQRGALLLRRGTSLGVGRDDARVFQPRLAIQRHEVNRIFIGTDTTLVLHGCRLNLTNRKTEENNG
ncbi:hypothetical protein D3C76_1097130 [compost metagenome]